MIPSTLAAEVTDALEDFLSTGFGPSNPALSGVVEQFLADTDNLFKGPYLSVDLPFRHAPEGGEPFPETPLGFTPWRHQRNAFNRLSRGQSTVIATGTGSGKTECFLYPVLDHCRAQAGAPGVKAIVIYPMNALASDQARRIAGIVHRTPSLHGKVTAGLYVGETGASPRQRMGADHVIENREVLRERPPDILLTNYKMLDLLLTRPVDFPLWRHNAAGVLRYLVVDELHTFDGAQGTDLACLIRRLRARLQAEELVCVGTSATIGGDEDRSAIVDYVSEVFHQPFAPDAVVGEVRQGIDEFLEDTIISAYLVPQPGLAERMDPRGYASADEYVRAQHEVFFGEVADGGLESREWRLALGGKLREHASFVNLLRVLDGSRPTPVAAVLERLRRSLPGSGIRDAELCLRALCALISVARRREDAGPDSPVRPLVSLKLHLWVRELRRMVCSVHEAAEALPAGEPDAGPPGDGSGVDLAWQEGNSGPARERIRDRTTSLRGNPTAKSLDSRLRGNDEQALVQSFPRRRESRGPDPNTNAHERTEPRANPPERSASQPEPLPGVGAGAAPVRRIRYADDLKPDEDAVHLPLVQCRECHATGWGCVKHAAEQRVGQDLRAFYNRFFLRDVDVNYLFPLAPDEPPPWNVRGRELTICGRCGCLAGRDATACPACGQDRLTRVFRPDAVVSRGTGKHARPELGRDCPYCGAREALIILGARASSLLATALAQLFVSRHNDDRRVIAFSDNVQDAAHRGSFFAARTWRNGLRAAIAQVVAKHDGIALGELPDRVLTWWGRGDASPGAADANPGAANPGAAEANPGAAEANPGAAEANPGVADANPGAFDEERFISEFIAPDRLWLRDFEALRDNGAVPAGSRLLSWVQRRVRWDTLAELTFGATIGRTLERTRVAAVGFDREALNRACEAAAARIREEFGELRAIDDLHVRSLVLGVLRRMRDRGAVESPLFGGYLRSGGNPFAIRDIALQDFGPRSALPVFPAPAADRHGVEALAGPRKSWYQTWVEKVLTPVNVLAATRNAVDVLHIVLQASIAAGLVSEVSARRTKVWALNPARLHVTARTTVMHCEKSGRTLVVPAREAELWQGVPCLDRAAQDRYVRQEPGSPTWAGRLYRKGDIHRIVSAEHTALVSRQERDRLQERFAAPDARPWEPNLLSATPTLELGVDIGDLSTVVMCSVPPAPVNWVQRTGRAGRRDGNALTLTVATGQPHDLYYYTEPMEMLGSRIDPPGVFLNAPAVLERQLTAFCLDCWVAGGVDEGAVPRTVRAVLNNVERTNTRGFPYPLLDFVAEHGDDLLARFFRAFEARSGTSRGFDRAFEPRSGAGRGFDRAFEPRSGTGRGFDDASRRYLGAFLHGADPEDSLRLRILKCLTEVVKERRSLRNNVETLGRRIRALEREPSDEASRKTVKALSDERRALQELLRKLNGKDTFGFLTDEGLLPNYAFPQEGVTLKSVIFKRRQAEEGEAEAEEDDVVVYEYPRPAAAALGELAPRNEFYAGGRRVAVRRIDTRVSPIERWRLCPSCPYCENIEAGDRHGACPRCGDPLWGDAGQRRELLRLRLVHAATQDRQSRIMDERDDREPLFYTRQLVADFDPESVSHAFATGDSGQPFGFEYVPAATFREMNFGRMDDQDSPTVFAGHAAPRRGFSLCRRCGGVEGADGEVQHARTCGAGDERAIVDGLYLYREFKSEAVRMLIPAAGSMNAEARISSFIAALELGLRRRFAGAVDHLRVMVCRFPAADSGAGIDFLMLHDTVPGGTGYLKQMMTDPDNLLSVFRMAHDALVQCACNADPLKDGCYRCVYAYRRSHDMASTSRDTAVAVLNGILEQAGDLKKVDGLRSVKVNPVLESELEARFIEALRRVDVDGEPVRVREDVVAGKPGHVLTMTGRTYYMEAQAELGASDGVAIASRPDFVIRPARASAGKRPIAVFMDGFEYHRDRTGEDSAKRLALVRAGYLVWSLTWHDLEAVLGKGDDAPDVLGDDDGHMARLQRTLDARWGTGSVRSRLAQPSFGLLVRFLRNPDAEDWKRAVFTRLLGLFEPADMQSASLKRELEEAAAEALPPMVQEVLGALPQETAFAGRGSWRDTSQETVFAGRGDWRDTPPDCAQVFLALPLVAVDPPEPDQLVVVLHLDDSAHSADQDYRRTWNGVLRLYNLLQFLPNAWWTTALGVQRDSYPEFATPEPEVTVAYSQEWADAISLADVELRTTMEALAARGVLPPEVGFELIDTAGEVSAEAELAWEAERGVVLLADQEGQRFAEAGWRTFQAGAPDLVEAISAWWTEVRS